MTDSDKAKTIDGFAYWIENEENGVCYIPLNLCEKIMKLLKEQEAKQVIRRQCKTEHPDGSIDYYAEWFCPHCNSLLKRGFDAAWIEYCFKCGKPILWEGR